MGTKPRKKPTVLYTALCVFATILFALVIADSLMGPNVNPLTSAASTGITGTGTIDGLPTSSLGASGGLIVWMTALMGMVGLGMLLYYHAHLKK